MKYSISILTSLALLFLFVPVTHAQKTSGKASKIDEARMRRDLEIAENVLGTLIKQQFVSQRTFFPLEINSSYQEGVGVTFSLPADFTTPIVFSTAATDPNDGAMRNSDGLAVSSPSQGWGVPGNQPREAVRTSQSSVLTDNASGRKRRNAVNMDSLRETYNDRVLEAARIFILDYSDIITQLTPNEKVIVTNQGQQPRQWTNLYFNATTRTHLSVEGLRADVMAYRQGKLSREQAVKKLHVVNAQSVDTVLPDLELISSIFSRLYTVDLSKTYFIEEIVTYERLKDYGAIFYMQTYSTNQVDYNRFAVPTAGLTNVDLETRNKKVTELYPAFEQELKENMLEYGKTVKSLQDDEVLVFQVQITLCPDCGIPSTLECSVKAGVLKALNAGTLDKKTALDKISVKRGAVQ